MILKLKFNSIPIQLRFEHYQLNHCNKLTSVIKSCLNYNKFYFPCLEVSLTTCCTLCCEECANLMQYYQHPYHVNITTLLSDIDALVKASDGIDCLRIIGGEPLLYPKLSTVIDYVSNEEKIKAAVIITNGTLILSDDVCKSLSNSSKCKVAISDYGKKSSAMPKLAMQLQSNHIKHTINKVVWKSKADVTHRHKSKRQMHSSYHKCPNRFFSLLNSELHMCPRSSHGSDLKIFPKEEKDFVRISDFYESTEQLQKEIIKLFRLDYITACNYCSEDITDYLPIVEPAKQCTHTQAAVILEEMMKKG